MVKASTRTRRAKRGKDELSEAEWNDLIDKRAQYYLGISGEEFVRRWQAGEFENPDRPEVIHVGMMLGIPFGQP